MTEVCAITLAALLVARFETLRCKDIGVLPTSIRHARL